MLTDNDVIARVIRTAAADGLVGFGGACAAAAVAINRIIFDGKALFVAALNGPFHEAGVAIGHVAVLAPDGTVWDADGRPKTLSGDDDIEHWGMLDPEDSEYRERALAAGIEWNDDTAYDAALIEMDDENDVAELWGEHFGEYPLSEFEITLTRACRAAGKVLFPASEVGEDEDITLSSPPIDAAMAI